MPTEPGSLEPQFTDLAIGDLEQIEDYISQNNPEAARRTITRIREVCFTIAEQPYMGRIRPDVHPDIRSFVVGNYVILYRLIGSIVEIVRIAQGNRNLQRLFQ